MPHMDILLRSNLRKADFDKQFMGLTTFSGDLPIMSDVIIAKNFK